MPEPVLTSCRTDGVRDDDDEHGGEKHTNDGGDDDDDIGGRDDLRARRSGASS